MTKVLLDTNIILDVLLDRYPFVENAAQLFQAIEDGKLQGYVAAISVNNLFYIIRKLQGYASACNAIERILTGMKICPVTQQTLETALHLKFKDFEDAIQVSCASEQKLDCIVTRNPKDFADATMAILSPEETLALIENRD